MKAVAYLDLLGFSNAVIRDTDEALSMLENYNSILQIGLSESIIHPSSNYSAELQDLARRNSIESFDDFLPFSDSIFITSEDCSDLLMQTGGFLEKTFHFTSHIYASPEDEQDPMAYHNIGMVDDGTGGLKAVDIPRRVPPTLFRGGVAYGDVEIITPIGILNKGKTRSYTLFGGAVVQAVGLEKKVKGPRIVFSKEVYSKLDQRAKLYCRLLPEDKNFYELLWPGMGYLLENRSTFQNEFSHFYDMFTPAYNLWRFYKDKEVGVHYERFIELIVASAITIYNYAGMIDFALQQIEKAIAGKFSEHERMKILGDLHALGSI